MDINQLTELDLFRLKALEHYDWVDEIPEETKKDIINFSLEDLKNFFMDDVEEIKSSIKDQMSEQPESWLRDQLLRIKNLLN
jgi:hypothetical protein